MGQGVTRYSSEMLDLEQCLPSAYICRPLKAIRSLTRSYDAPNLDSPIISAKSASIGQSLVACQLLQVPETPL